MHNHPIPATKAEVLSVLSEILYIVEHDDSFEGSFEYTMPEPGDPPDTRFRLRAAYRVGNSMGQGGLKMVGSMEPIYPSDEAARAALDGTDQT
jgi:hypothetical protein